MRGKELVTTVTTNIIAVKLVREMRKIGMGTCV